MTSGLGLALMSKNYVIEIAEGDSLEIRRYSAVPGSVKNVNLFEAGHALTYVSLPKTYPATGDAASLPRYMVSDWLPSLGGVGVFKILTNFSEKKYDTKEPMLRWRATFGSWVEAEKYIKEQVS